MSSPGTAAPATKVGVVTRDERLAGDVRRLCAVSGAQCEVTAGDADLRRLWRTSSAVVVDGAVAGAVAASGLRPRDGVVVIAADAGEVQPWRDAVAIGASGVLALPEDERRFVEWLLDRRHDGESPTSRVVACRAGHGGAGGSTFAVAMAVAGRRHGLRTTLVDGDPLSGGLDLLVGAEHTPGTRWSGLAALHGRLDADALVATLPTVPGLGRLLSGDRDVPGEPSPEAIHAVVSALARVNDVVVLDLGPHACASTRAALEACDAAFLATAARVRAVAATVVVAADTAAAVSDVRVVVHRPRAAALRPGDVAAALGLDLVGEVGFSTRVATAADRGELVRAVSRGRVAEVAARALAGVAGRPASDRPR